MSPGEAYCLDRILKWLLRYQDGVVASFHLRKRMWLDLTPNQHPKSDRYRYSIGRTTVYRNRLVWMLVHRMEIPTGFYIDHANGNSLDDHPDNLQLMSRKDSDLQGGEFSLDQKVNEIGRWFEFMGRHGREPETPIELNWITDGFYMP